MVLQEILERREDGVEEMILGMMTQLAEADDTYIVEDLQSKILWFFYHRTLFVF